MIRYLFRLRHAYALHERGVAIGLLFTNGISLFAWVAWYGLIFLPTFLLDGSGLMPQLQLLLLAVPVSSGLIHYLVQSGRLRLAAYVFVGFYILAFGVVLMIQQGIGSIYTLLLMIPLVAAGVLLNRRDALISGFLLAILILAGMVYQIGTAQPNENAYADTTLVLLIGTVSLLLLATFRTQPHSMGSTLAVDHARWMLQLGHGEFSSSTDVLGEVLRAVRQQFEFDFAQIHLLDENGVPVRRVRGGIRTIAEQDLTAAADPTNAVFQAAQTGELVQVGPTSSAAWRAGLQPEMEYGLYIPVLGLNERVTGVMDVQKVSSFTADELTLLTLLGQQLSRILEQMDQLDTYRRGLHEQEGMVMRLQHQLRSMQSQRQQLVSDVWTEYVQGRNLEAVGFDIQGGQVVPASEMAPHVRDAMARGEVYTTEENGQRIVNVPIKLRDEILGAMSFSVPAGQALTERQIELANTVAVRLGTALENTRLLEQTQAQARRERKANEAANLLLSATDVESLLQTAAASFNDVLGAVGTRVYLSTELLSVESLSKPSGHHQNGGGS